MSSSSSSSVAIRGDFTGNTDDEDDDAKLNESRIHSDELNILGMVFVVVLLVGLNMLSRVSGMGGINSS